MTRLRVSKKACVGCRMCELTCSAQRAGEVNYKRARIRVQEAYPMPAAPSFCRHCPKPACVAACENGSLAVAADGKVRVSEGTCTKCLACVEACPFGSIFVDVVTGYPLLCDSCGECVDFCPTEALSLR